MKRFITVLLVILISAAAHGALADSVQGSWSGSAKAMGHSFKASCSFNGSGGFSARAAGMSVSGSYTISGSSVTLSAKGTSITFSLKTDGNRQSLSGSGRYQGVKGSIYLSRTLSDSQLAKTRTSPYGKWKIDGDEYVRQLEIYESGYVYFSEVSVKESQEAAFKNVVDGFSSGGITDYASLISAIDSSGKAKEYIGKAECAQGTVTVTPLNGECPSLKEYEKDGKYVFDYKVEADKLTFAGTTFNYSSTLDKKPAAALFRPYITLERGDKGEAVESAQERLIALEFLEGAADGDFGPQTERSVKAFEKARGFAEDGALSGEELMNLYDEEESQ